MAGRLAGGVQLVLGHGGAQAMATRGPALAELQLQATAARQGTARTCEVWEIGKWAI